MFKFNLYNIVGLKWGKKTNIISLYNTSSILTYFTFPIVINFYSMFLNCSDSTFEKSLGEKKMLSIGGINLLNYFPLIMFLTILLTCSNLQNKILKIFGHRTNYDRNNVTKEELKKKQYEFQIIFPDIVSQVQSSKYFFKNKKKLCVSEINHQFKMNFSYISEESQNKFG